MIIIAIMVSGLTRARSWCVVGRAKIQAFTFSRRRHSRSRSVVRRAQIQVFFFKKKIVTRVGLLGPYCKKKWGAVGTSTRADACAFTSEPQLSSIAAGSRRGRLPRNLHARFDSLVRLSSWAKIVQKKLHACGNTWSGCLETLLRNWHSCWIPWSVFRNSNGGRVKNKTHFLSVTVWEPGSLGAWDLWS